MATQKPKTFRATLEPLRGGLGWVIARIPFDVKKTWGHSRVKVRGEVNGVTFRTSLFSSKDGPHFLLVNKKVQKCARIRLGNTAEFCLEVDTAPREVVIPSELSAVLKQSKTIMKWFNSLTYSYRYEISRRITEPKSAASRKRRAEQMAERVLETMEAERELPPLIKTALAQNGKAREGWGLMTPIQRRSELFAIFGYVSPESRARRLEKAMQAAVAAAERKEAE